ncbi:glycosyltransferase family 2 protein [Pelosinus sp. sgz500959]|uniref:glycosyltransferase family 2 protein n=1 Tax=Pelosinus sp. sgz500959 TaxID=3242472 RepID=UPI003672A4AD
MELISVIIPTWNRSEVIQKAIMSALNQTYSKVEVLVCDDGSTDYTQQIVESIPDPRLKWIPGVRSGRPAIPRNRGIRESQGQWLAFLDSDDEWLPNKLDQQLSRAKKTGCKAVSTNAYRLFPERGIVGTMLGIERAKLSFKDMLDQNSVICSSALLHHSLLDIVLGFPEEPDLKVCEDYAFWLRIATQTEIAFVFKPLVIYQDDAQHSVRGLVNRSVWEERKVLFRNFLYWSVSAKISEKYITEARAQYNRAIQKLQQLEELDIFW